MKRIATISAIAVLAFVSFISTLDYAVGQTAEPEGSREKDERAIQGIIDDYAATWNDHDMKASAELFSDDADCVVISGKHMKGRDEIFRYHDELHKAAFKDRRLSAQLKDLRFLRPDVAIGHVAFEGKTTSTAADTRGATTALATVVLEREQGRWSIAAFHNTLLTKSGPVAPALPPDPK